jgi:ketosteroid isomerase-like protein
MTTRERVAAAVAAMQAADAPAACAHFAHDARYVEAKRETLVGRAAIEAHFARFFHHVPSFRFVVDAVVVEEARAVVLYKFGVTRRVGSAGSDFLQTERDGCAFVVVRNDGIALWKEYEG